ncbi:MAG: lanthionine synthetase C family protein [Bacteroidales bacterium]|nr:lanthionine synthetase C family protein [Bacteroidales bacterium]
MSTNYEVNNKITDKIHQTAKILSDKKLLTDNSSILGGNTGISLFHFYYSKIFQNEESNNIAYDIITKTFENISKGFSYHTFAGGLAGVGWLIEFLEQNDFLECSTDETIGELDDYLYNLMINEIKSENYDYLHGASGIALYFLKRKKSEKIIQYLSEYVDLLADIAIKEENRIKWISDISIDDNTKEKVYNLSMSHGIASLISVMSKLYAQNINKEKTKTLLEGAVNYLLYQEQDTNQYYSYFPSSIKIKNQKKETSRLAWCYGDLGISVALWNASKVLENKDMENKALEILQYSAGRKDLIKNSVVDAGLCHGAAGIAHIFNRMYRNTKQPEFKEAANYWYAETLKMANHKDSLSGYKAFRTEKYGGWTEEFGFLEGIAGIGLALMSSISDIDPAWDEILLLS